MEPKMIFGIKTTEPQVVAFARFKGPFQIPAAIADLARWIEEQGYSKIGPPLTLYYSNQDTTPEEKLEWEVQFAIGDAVAGERLAPKEDKGVKRVKPITVAYTYYRGPYEQVGPAYGALYQWMEKKGYRIAGAAREINWSDEATTPPEKLMTEIQFPIQVEPKSQKQ
jgi:effector-binding domain-containing protein